MKIENKMKIENLFEKYTELVTNNANCEKIFKKSGMVNRYMELEYGFFPLGSGILTSKSKIAEAEITTCKILVLGNDFGTLKYVEDECPDNREKASNATITNLINRLKLNPETTFFTNLFLGLRDNVTHHGTTNTKLIAPRSDDYKNLCFSFFKHQIDMLNPKVVICLGKEVGQSLSKLSPEVFSKFSLNKTSITKIFADTTNDNYTINTSDNIFGKRKFILIPHPSYAHINWKKNNIEEKIKLEIID